MVSSSTQLWCLVSQITNNFPTNGVWTFSEIPWHLPNHLFGWSIDFKITGKAWISCLSSTKKTTGIWTLCWKSTGHNRLSHIHIWGSVEIVKMEIIEGKKQSKYKNAESDWARAFLPFRGTSFPNTLYKTREEQFWLQTGGVLRLHHLSWRNGNWSNESSNSGVANLTIYARCTMFSRIVKIIHIRGL